MNFKIGDKVIYISGYYGDSQNNPLYGGNYGKIIGKVIHTYGKHTIEVKWNDARVNTYRVEDLKIAQRPGHHLTKIFK